MALATNVSTAALVVNILFMLVLVQSAGGLFAGCNAFGFFDIGKAQCEGMFATFLGRKPDEATKDFATLALVFPRVEACLFLGMGLGSVYAFAFLARGTKEVAVVHFMHGCWACAVCMCHMQNAGLLKGLGIEPEANVLSSDKLMPFVVLTGVQDVLYWVAFYLSIKSGGKAKKK